MFTSFSNACPPEMIQQVFVMRTTESTQLGHHITFYRLQISYLLSNNQCQSIHKPVKRKKRNLGQ
jgi:hypothetical protein